MNAKRRVTRVTETHIRRHLSPFCPNCKSYLSTTGPVELVAELCRINVTILPPGEVTKPMPRHYYAAEPGPLLPQIDGALLATYLGGEITKVEAPFGGEVIALVNQEGQPENAFATRYAGLIGEGVPPLRGPVAYLFTEVRIRENRCIKGHGWLTEVRFKGGQEVNDNCPDCGEINIATTDVNYVEVVDGADRPEIGQKYEVIHKCMCGKVHTDTAEIQEQARNLPLMAALTVAKMARMHGAMAYVRRTLLQ